MPDMMINAENGGSFKAYVATPETLPAPAVLIIQEIFGVNDVMRKKTDWLASQGYIAVCPDLFWRIEPYIQLTDQTDAEWQRAFELFKAFDVDQGVKDLEAAKLAVENLSDCTGDVGCLGYCLGGKLAYLLAARTKIDASIGYHGVGLEGLLNEASAIKTPLMLHTAGKDDYVPPAAQEKITSSLSGHPKITIHNYPKMNHAFTRFGGAHYDEAQAKIADERTLKFLAKHLKRNT